MTAGPAAATPSAPTGAVFRDQAVIEARDDMQVGVEPALIVPAE
jgi:hypothetical protein